MNFSDDEFAAAIKRVVAGGADGKQLTYEELNAALPPDLLSSEQIEEVMRVLSDLGIKVVDGQFRARPAKGDIDHAALSREFMARFPKIRAGLAK